MMIVPIALRGHASRDAPRHKWHRLWIQLAERMAQVAFAPLRRATLRDQSSQSPSLRFRPRLRRGSFVLTLIRGSLQMGHPWPSAAQSASMPIAPRIQRQDSAFTHVAICGVHAVALQKRLSDAASLGSRMTCV